MYADRHPPSVVVVVFEEDIDPALARSVLRHRWEVVDARAVVSPLKSILIHRPRVVIVQMPAGPAADAAAGLLSRLSQHWHRVPVLALGVESGGESEVMARVSGAHAFLPRPVSPPSLDELLESFSPGWSKEPVLAREGAVPGADAGVASARAGAGAEPEAAGSSAAVRSMRRGPRRRVLGS